MTEDKRLVEKMKKFDELFPGFFRKGYCAFKEYNAGMLEHMEEYDDEMELFSSYEEALSYMWLKIMDQYYPKELETIPMEDLYLLYQLFQPGYKSDGEREVISQDTTFEHMLPLGERIFALQEKEEKKYSWEDQNKWNFHRNEKAEELNFAINEQLYGEKCDHELMKKFFWFGEVRKARHNINHDYCIKSEGLYQGILSMGIGPEKRHRWIQDFIELTELVIRGKYRIDDEIFVLEELPWMELDHENDMDIVMGAACSYQTCVIYFLDYIVEKKEEAFRRLLRILYLTIRNIYGKEAPEEDVFELSVRELYLKIYNFTNKIYRECQRENDCDLKMNCLPEYHNTGYMAGEYASSHNRQITVHSEEAIQKYVEKPKKKEAVCAELALKLKNAGYERDDSSYINSYLEKKENYEKYQIIYNKMYELAIVQEAVYLMCDALAVAPVEISDVPSIKRLCAGIQDFIYEDFGYDAVEKELDKMSSKSFELGDCRYELNIHQKFLAILEAELDSDQDIEFLMQLKHDFFVQVLNRGVNEETRMLFEDVNNRILQSLENKAQEENTYKESAEEISILVDRYAPDITRKINSYTGGTFTECDQVFASVKRVLSTAEFLYRRYVLPYAGVTRKEELPMEIQDMDFSCIALEYYTALEQLANLLLFTPYRAQVLQPRYSECKNKREQFDQHMQGYVGEMKINFLADMKNNRIKPALELGNLAYLYKDSLSGNGRVKPKYIYLKEYIEKMGLDMTRAREFGKKIFEIRELRNESAHGGNILDINKARKAQDVSYIHIPNPDIMCQINVADQCHEIVVELLKWFAQE